MDFMSDELFDGRRIRLLTIVDHFTRESIAIEVGQRMRGKDVVATLDRLPNCDRVRKQFGSTMVQSLLRRH